LNDDKAKSATDQILDRVLEFSEGRGLFDCGTIIVGLSGGPDSVALLTILKELKARGDLKAEICAFHCNHHLRPGVCDEEAEQVRHLCGKLGVGLKVIDFDCACFAKMNRISDETAGRVLRYEAFEQYALSIEKEAGQKVFVAIAHHKDDVAETMMMNLFRGSGLEGLVNPKSRSGRLIRPLLCVKKSELVAFLESRGIAYATDLTNLTTDGTRNTWRNDFLPRIGEFYNEDPAVPLARTYKLLSDDLDFISSYSGEAYISNRMNISDHPALRVSGIRDLHTAIKSRALRLLWQETFGDLIDFEETHLSDSSFLAGRDVKGEVTIDMPFGRKAYRYGDIFAFVNAGGMGELAGKIAEEQGFFVSYGPVDLDISLEDIETDEGFSADIPNSALKLRVRIIENKGDLEYNNSSWFCPVEAFHEGRLTLGNCSGSASGLHIRKAGSAGGKDLNRLMTDLKIPGSARGQVLFIRDGGEVLWLPGFGHGVGFTNSVSRERYIAGRADEGAEPGRLVRFAIERKQ